ncbi:MAG: DUF4198 domain-containing protein [Marinosulfonomonas sp.]
MTFRIFLSLLMTLASTSFVFGHEFWISPVQYSVTTDENIVADLRVGQNFKGGAFAYIPDNFERFEIANGEDVLAVPGRIGDRPALNMQAPRDGLWVVIHETTDSNLTYRDWDLFADFVEHKDLTGTIEAHLARNLSKVGVKETYRRFAKSLIAVGTPTGADREFGLRTEIIAEANPYVDDLSAGFPVRVMFEGAPRRAVQLEIFDKDPAGEVRVSTLRTDNEGRVRVPVQKGHAYNLDAVVMLPLEVSDPETDPAWQSLWAGLTFAVPG